MQFPESWLREYCNPPLDTNGIAQALTMGGFEVEDLRPVAPAFEGVVVGRIVNVQPHPNADRLRICEVDVGTSRPLTIVCGAPNARAGLLVPCATVGAQLPESAEGMRHVIQVGKLRAVESQGMLCSASELGLQHEQTGLMELPLDLSPGTNLRAALGLDDVVFTLKLTPNLGHALSVYGVARELAAITGAPLTPPQSNDVAPTISDALAVNIQNSDLCGRFSGRVVRNVNPQAPTPSWMVERLARCGQRSVSALVDISNYVMFEHGQPTHMFDLGRIHGNLQVRWARAGEPLKLLNGQTIALQSDFGVIADDQQVESLAGIMGGDATAVTDSTQDIYIEAAFWVPEAIAGKARRLHFSTEAAHRFERGVDPTQTVATVERISQLVQEICATSNTQFGPVTDTNPVFIQRAPVTLRVARAAKIIGMPLTQEECENIFKRQGFSYTPESGAITVTPPAYRFDLQIEEDLIEEIARLIGYENLPDTPVRGEIKPLIVESKKTPAFALRRALAGLGYLETVNYSFVEDWWETEMMGNPNSIRVINPIASQLTAMRSSLFGSLVQALKYNVDRRAEQLRLFEMGRVFRRDVAEKPTLMSVAGICQPMRVAGLVYGSSFQQDWQSKQRLADFFDVKGDVESLLSGKGLRFEAASHPALHPGQCARILNLSGKFVGIIGALHPKWKQRFDLPHAPILFELDADQFSDRNVVQAGGLKKQLPVERDIAIVVQESLTHDTLLQHISQAPHNDLLQKAWMFDIFIPPPGAQATSDIQAGEKSCAVRLQIGDASKPLTDGQIDEVVQSIVGHLKSALNARLRT